MPLFNAKSAATSAGGVTLATFSQGHDIAAYVKNIRENVGKAAAKDMNAKIGPGVCYILSIRFIVHSILGLPPLGIDLGPQVNGRDVHIFRIPENTAIFTRYPNINNQKLPMNSYIANQEANRKLLEPWLLQNGLKRLSKIEQHIGFKAGIVGGYAVAKYLDENKQVILNGHGFAIFGASGINSSGENSGHAMVVHTGPSGEWMFMDVNFGWFWFKNYGSFSKFMGSFWEGTGYNYGESRLLNTFIRVTR